LATTAAQDNDEIDLNLHRLLRLQPPISIGKKFLIVGSWLYFRLIVGLFHFVFCLYFAYDICAVLQVLYFWVINLHELQSILKGLSFPLIIKG